MAVPFFPRFNVILLVLGFLFAPLLSSCSNPPAERETVERGDGGAGRSAVAGEGAKTSTTGPEKEVSGIGETRFPSASEGSEGTRNPGVAASERSSRPEPVGDPSAFDSAPNRPTDLGTDTGDGTGESDVASHAERGAEPTGPRASRTDSGAPGNDITPEADSVLGTVTRPPPPPALLDPGLANARAPEEFRVRFETTAGDFVVELHRDWAPRGVDRFYNLVRIGFYDGARFFRVGKGAVAQFGIHGDPRVSAAWSEAWIADDPVEESNERGRIAFAGYPDEPNTRSTQLFINLRDNPHFDEMGFAPIGEIVEGMDAADAIFSGYGEVVPHNENGPNPRLILKEGNAYLDREFPELDVIQRARIVH